MGIIRVATSKREVVRLWELATTHMVHTFTPHGVVCSVVLFIIAVSLRGLLTA
ncbi:MAG: hypothetical protein KatS3mg056_3028 [Chloroflexus sp.]|jgi:hypothetical protein|nr:MAG: hypothetical protein KatS3mg056_3028 [Chloroflexus sp.]